MPSPREVEYWEGIAERSIPGEKGCVDNIWKRPHQLARLCKYTWVDQSVLEIGVGNGVVAASLAASIGGNWSYVGTELSPRFARFATARGKLAVVNADVKELPRTRVPPGFSRIIAFDSLEHVRPEDRPAGYRCMAEVAAPGCLLFIHYSLGISHHDKEFDHPFGLSDLAALEQNGFRLQTFEEYECDHPNGIIPYCFAVMKREEKA